MRPWWIGLALGLVVACGHQGDTNDSAGGSADANAISFLGLYATKSVQAPTTSCDETTLAAADGWKFKDRYFKLAPDEILGQRLPVAYFACTTPTSCADKVDLSYTFETFDGNRWLTSPLEVSSPAKEGKCSFSYSVTSITLAGTALQLRRETHAADVDRPADESSCTGGSQVLDKMYASNKDKLPCTALLVVHAEKSAVTD